MLTIRERILAATALGPARAARDLDALTAGLNAAAPMALQERYVTARTILSECVDGGSILAALDGAAASNAAVRYAVKFLGQDGGLNVGDPITQAMLDQLATGAVAVLTQEQATQVKNLAKLPQLVDRLQVEAAMYNPDGSEKQ
jgi:hypothetical protein